MPSTQSTSKAPAMSYPGTVKRALSSADTSSVPVSVNAEAGSFTVAMVTGTPCRNMIEDPRSPGRMIIVDEVVVPEGVDLSRAQGMPLVDGHRTGDGIAAILGKVDNVRLEDGVIVGEAMFASSHEHLLKDVQRGFYRQGSIRAEIQDIEWVERPDDVPLVLITRSLLTDYSLVAVGADPHSIIRSADTNSPPKVTVRAADPATPPTQETPMDLEEIVRAAEAAIAAADAAVAAEGTAPELVERVRSLRTARAAEDESTTATDAGTTEVVERAAEDAAETPEDKAEREEILDLGMPSGLQDLPDEDDQSELIESPITLGALNIDSSTPEWAYEDPETLEVIHYVVGDEVLAAGRAWTCATDHEATETFRFRDYDGGPVLWVQREKRAPMGDSRHSRFLDLPLGVRAVRHAVLRLDRAVLDRRQCAETTFEVPWMLGRRITTADSCRIAHHKLPGGEVTGKVTGIDLVVEGGGKRSAKITMVSIPGSGAINPEPGPDQQQTGDIVYSTSYRGVREPVNAFALATQPPRIYAFENDYGTQHAAAVASGDPVGTIGTLPTRLKIAFAPLREEDLLTRRMSVTCLPPALPKQINLRPDLGGA